MPIGLSGQSRLDPGVDDPLSKSCKNLRPCMLSIF